MVSNKKRYMAYALDRHRNTYSPPLETQLAEITQSFKRRFGQEPAALFVGPVSDETGQVLIREHEVWLEIPVRERHYATAE